MKKVLIVIFTLLSINSFSQNSITFQVEELSKPEKLLQTESYEDIYKELIQSDLSISRFDIEDHNIDIPYNIIAKSKASADLVNYEYNSFFYGMYEAHANHRPFVLSPDMIWLLISQGFAHHVNVNPEKLRHHFIDFSGKLSLVVSSDAIKLDDPNSNWEIIFPSFTKQIRENTKSNLADILTCNFSTTTSVERIASEITLMKAMESYFEFIVLYAICGIPEITLKGTPEDWQKVLEKTKMLEKYDLKWWTKKLEPILEEFVKASEGKINKTFWRNMFKYHSQKKYGAPKIIDGWIIKFFPYDKDGKRNNLKELKGGNNLPKEIVKVDLKYIDNENNDKITPLELWAGFIGLEQNNDNYSLTPQIGWMIRKKDAANSGLIQKIEADNKEYGVSIRVKEVPEALNNPDISIIKNLKIEFIGNIIIPEWLSRINIWHLGLKGVIDKKGIERIIQLFPNTNIVINGENVYSPSPYTQINNILISSEDWVNIGWEAFFIKRDYETAIFCYKKAIDLDSENQTAYKELGESLIACANKNGDNTLFSQGIDAYIKAISFDPKIRIYYDELSYALLSFFKKGNNIEEQLSKTERLFIEVDNITSNIKTAYNLARIYSLANRKSDALKWLDKALSGDFGSSNEINKSGIENEKDFANIKNSKEFEKIIAEYSKREKKKNN